MLGKANKALSKVCVELGIGVGSAKNVELSALADHVEALLAFEGDARSKAALGNVWDGLNSPFDAVSEGLSQLRGFRDRLSGHLEGPTVATRLQAAVLSNPESLSEFRIAFTGFDEAIGDLDAAADLKQVKELHDACLEEIEALKAITDADVAKDVSALSAPLRRLFDALALTDRLGKLRQRLSASEEGRRIASLVRHPADAGSVASVAKWLDRLRGCQLPDALRQRLVSAEAPAARQEVRQTAGAARGLLDRKKELAGEIANYWFMKLGDVALDDLRSKLSPLLSARASARDFLQLLRVRAPLHERGLQSFIETAETLRIPYERFEHALLAVVAYHQANNAIRRTKALSVSGPEIEARRKQFAERDREKLQRDRAALRSLFLKCSPPRGSDSGSRKTWTELALLRKELDKEKRHEPVRELLMRAGRAMQELKPCFMMSPMSLAKFSGDRNLQFDLLVIDEASQMKPEDALGGLLRSKQVVVVGDRKQLPPTDFFSRSAAVADGDEGDDSVAEESILENCETAFRRVRRLSWHYRSRCESLIRFANREFYEDRLITFPAPVPGSFSIDHVRIAGSYKGSRNHAEANAIIEAAIDFMLAHAGRDSDATPSLGLVAINSQQRDLIREEFARRSTSQEEVAAYLKAVQEKGEEFFIKNLENVQGDERDYVYVSMTYGPEPGAAAMHQRFGPINSAQGHRRLNVLFSRARIRIGLFSSFGSADVLPGEKSREGVRALKKYLEYVEARGRALADSTGAVEESVFEREVAARLEARGYTVDRQVGVSGYRIDLGVRHPLHPSRYLAGIECDGAAYHSSKSARDRDRLREEVLRGLGWNILRVWSTDWFHAPGAETDKLAKRLDDLQRESPDEVPGYPLRAASAREGPGASPATGDGPETAVLSNEGVDAVPSSPQDGSASRVDFEAATPLTADEARELLVNYRESVIMPSSKDWDISRSILRDSMIEAIVAQRLDDPDDWTRKVPMYLRQGTEPSEKRHLDSIAEIMARVADR
jgi:very-short-patch-repair endonuclease